MSIRTLTGVFSSPIVTRPRCCSPAEATRPNRRRRPLSPVGDHLTNGLIPPHPPSRLTVSDQGGEEVMGVPRHVPPSSRRSVLRSGEWHSRAHVTGHQSTNQFHQLLSAIEGQQPASAMAERRQFVD